MRWMRWFFFVSGSALVTELVPKLGEVARSVRRGTLEVSGRMRGGATLRPALSWRLADGSTFRAVFGEPEPAPLAASAVVARVASAGSARSSTAMVTVRPRRRGPSAGLTRAS